MNPPVWHPPTGMATTAAGPWFNQEDTKWKQQVAYEHEAEGESLPPLLEELEIDLRAIGYRLRAVVFFGDLGSETVRDCDMVGALTAVAVVSLLSLFSGRLHFNYIYGLSVFGALGFYGVFNLMSRKDVAISLYATASVLGYGLYPLTILALMGVFWQLDETWWTLASTTFLIMWSTACATRYFEVLLRDSTQRYLFAYPLLLFYTCFVLQALV